MHARWLKVREAAKLLGMEYEAVRWLTTSGKLPAVRGGQGRATLIREDDLEKYAAQKAKEKK